jgi:hypothetical protein
MIARRLATITATVAIAVAGGAAVPSLASASTRHVTAKPMQGVAWASQKPAGVAWASQKPAGVAWASQKPAGVAWTR